MSRTTNASTASERASRFDVRSPDGTPLAVWVAGDGPPLVLVHGSLCDHTRLDLLVDELRGKMTTFALDRRGAGASGDTPTYAIQREFEDVATVVDAVAARSGTPVAVLGHSYGASCAMGAATLTSNVGHLILYEPSLGLPYPPGSIEATERALAAGDREAAIRLVLVDILGMTDDEFEAMRVTPVWGVRLATAPLVPRESRAEEGFIYRPGQFGGVTARTLLLEGTKTAPDLRATTQRAAAAIPGAETRLLEGHGHIAHLTDPALLAGIVWEFISS